MVGSDKKMTIESFVLASEVDPIYFESTEFLAPEKNFEKTFAMLREAMIEKGVVAIAQSNQRGREQTVVIRPYGDNGLTLHYMFFDNEVRSFSKWTKVNVDKQEVEIAGMLIDAMTDTFDATAYSDSFTRTYKGLINSKIEGTAPVLPAQVADPVADPKANLMAMLQASLSAPAVTAVKAKKAAKAAPKAAAAVA